MFPKPKQICDSIWVHSKHLIYYFIQIITTIIKNISLWIVWSFVCASWLRLNSELNSEINLLFIVVCVIFNSSFFSWRNNLCYFQNYWPTGGELSRRNKKNRKMIQNNIYLYLFLLYGKRKIKFICIHVYNKLPKMKKYIFLNCNTSWMEKKYQNKI